MANFSFSEMKKLAGGAASVLAQKAEKVKNQSVVLAKKASDKAAQAGKVAVINANIGLEKQKLGEKAKVLGLRYMELFGENPAEELGEEIAEMKAIREKIEALQAEAEAVKKAAEEAGEVIEEAPAEETPAEEAVAEEAPVEEAPVEEMPVEETPAEEVPTEEN